MSGDRARPDIPILTLDGWSGSGKSTLARTLAGRLGWTYLDSGAWYRALAWAVLREGARLDDEKAILDLLFRIQLSGLPDGQVRVNDDAPGTQLRTPEVDRAVSQVADHPRVRAALNERMRAVALPPGAAVVSGTKPVTGLVVDGRDAGSVIFPEARLKVFVEASLDERARRRSAQQPGQDFVTVRALIQDRDRRDGTRGASAPSPATAGRVLLNESFTVEEAVGRLLAWARETWPEQAALRGPISPPNLS